MELSLHLTRHKIGHFGDVLPSQPLGSVLKKPNPTKLTHEKRSKLTQKHSKTQSYKKTQKYKVNL